MLENWKLAVGNLEAAGALNARDAWMTARPLTTTQAIPNEASASGPSNLARYRKERSMRDPA